MFVIYKGMYVAYLISDKVQIQDNEKIITATVRYFEDMVVLYYEGTEKSVKPSDFVKGEFKKFPDGGCWFKLTEIFHYFMPKTADEWIRKIDNKKSYISVNKLKEDKISSYIYWHYRLQENNPINCDKFFSIYIYKDTIFMYGERPIEKVTIEERNGKKEESLGVESWTQLMNEHFKQWPDGEFKWIELG